jgi:hypothetical protein
MKNRAKIMMMALTLVALLGTAKAQTELYKKYEHLEDVTVVCIMKLPINDTMTVQVTLLAPQTKEAVHYLVEEFNLGLDKEEVYNQFGQEKKYTLYTYYVPKDDIKKRFGEIKTDENYKDIAILAYNYNMGTIVIFHDIDTKERDRAIGSFLTGTLTEPEKFPTIDNANNKK